MTDRWELVDLAARRLGGMVLAASDEFFAAKENLLEPAGPVSAPGRYTDRGKWMDGWETRRRRQPGHDWCIVRLGVPGVVRGAVVDTSHFRGNHPEACSLEGLAAGPDPNLEELTGAAAGWLELLGRTGLEADSRQRFAVEAPVRVTHVRLRIYPDGGVARLRLPGRPLPDLRPAAAPDGRADLAAVVNGGQVVGCSDRFFSAPEHLIMPGDAADMGDGWETRRRRGPGHDWAVVRLAAAGTVERVEVDTTNFKGNYPDRCTVEAVQAPQAGLDEVPQAGWRTLVPPTRLGPHARHVLAVTDREPATHVRLGIHPDGGVSRLRVWGRVSEDGWRRWGAAWLNALPAASAAAELRTCCGSGEWARRVAAGRPYADLEALAEAADRIWAELGPGDWREAFAAHPRIGVPPAGSPAWSRQEQAGVAGADPAVLAALAEGNRAYEQRFGQVFVVCASGRSAQELLAALRRRLANDPDTELLVAAEEQRKITRLRLDKLVRP